MPTETPHTLIIGDDIAGNLYDAFQQIPGTGAMWVDPDGWPLVSMWAGRHEIKNVWDRIAKGAGGHLPDRMPDTALVSLGRGDILLEPADPDPDFLKQLAEDTGKVIDQINALGIKKVAWVLPPAVKSEGKARAIMEKVLADKGVRVLAADRHWSDPSEREQPPVALADDTLQKMARLIATWLPLGGPSAHGVVIGQRQPGDGSGAADQGALVNGGSFLQRLSRPAKIGLAGGLALAIGGAVYAAQRRYGR